MIKNVPDGWEIGFINDKITNKIKSSGINIFCGNKNYLSTECIKNNKINKIEEVISYKKRPSRANLQPQTNDVFFAKMKETEKVLIITEKIEDEYILSTGFMPIRPYLNKLNSIYLSYYFKSKQFNEIKDKLSYGGTQKALNNQNASKIKIPIPPLQQQKKIVKVLDISSALLEKQKELIAKYDLFLKSKFIEMFGNPMVNSLKWNYKSFSEIAHCRLGKMVDKKQNIGKEKFIYLANLNVQWGYFKLKELRKMYFSDNEKIEFSLRKGDLLICEGGEIGRTAIWKEEIKNCYFQKALHRCRVDKSIVSPEYISHFMLHMIKSGGLSKYIVSATIPHLTGVKLKKINIPIPPITLQNKFAKIVEKIETIKTKETKKLNHLETLHKSLMDKAFKGEIK